MALLSSRFAVQVFVMIYITINTVYGTLEETLKCYRQLNSAFGDCQTGIDCLKYAIEHYVKDQNTANYETEINSIKDAIKNYAKIQNTASSSQSGSEVFNILESSADVSDFNKNQIFDEQSNENDDAILEVLNNAKRFRKALEPMTEGPDYATIFHNELETMIRGKGVPTKDQFCKEHITPALENPEFCILALEKFGKSAISAVRWAFKSYTLKECQFLQTHFPNYGYITQYMQAIIRLCETNHLAKSPLNFCEKTVMDINKLKLYQHSKQSNYKNAT